MLDLALHHLRSAQELFKMLGSETKDRSEIQKLAILEASAESVAERTSQMMQEQRIEAERKEAA